MGLLHCWQMFDLIRFYLLTLPRKLIVGTIVSLINKTKQIISHLSVESWHKPPGVVGSRRKNTKGTVISRRKTPLGSRISLQITKGRLDLAANTKGRSNLAAKPLMDGQISPQTTELKPKNRRYMILILIFFFFWVWLEMKVRERKNRMTKRDNGQSVWKNHLEG